MRKYALFIIAFVVIIAAFVKSQRPVLKTSANKQRLTLVQWPGVIKKNAALVRLLPGQKNISKKSVGSGGQVPAASVDGRKLPARGVASLGPDPAAVPGSYNPRQVLYNETPARSRGRRYSNGGFYFNANSAQYQGAQNASAVARQPSFTSGSDSVQELAAFTRTPDISINVAVDPELSYTFEDQIRKFREQNQLTSQELQELEIITNTFTSMAGSVQRGQVPMSQVNAEAIKITRSFINLKRRVEGRAQ